MSFVDAGSGNPSSGSVDAIDVRHCSPHNITRIPMTCGFIFSLSQSLLDAQHQVALYETSQSILETEIRIIEKSLGGECLGFSEKNPFKNFASSGDEGSQKPHAFKSSSFTIPTECSYCAVRGTSVYFQRIDQGLLCRPPSGVSASRGKRARRAVSLFIQSAS